METELEKINRLKKQGLSISNPNLSALPFNPNERQGGFVQGLGDTMEGVIRSISNIPQGVENTLGNIYEGTTDFLFGKKYETPTYGNQKLISPVTQNQQTPSNKTGSSYNLPSNNFSQSNVLSSVNDIMNPVQAPELSNIYTDDESKFLDEFNTNLLLNAQAEYDPEEALQEANRLFQSQIDAQEAYYNDLIEQSRMTNQPEYQKNLDMLRLQQLAGGYGTSGAARAETQKQQNENQRVQNSYESVLRAEMQDKINAIQGNITNYAQKAKENFEKLKSESTEKYLQALRDRPTQRKAAVGQIVEQLLNLGIDIEDLSEEQISEYAKQLSNSATGNITSDNIRSEYKSLKAQAEASQKEAELEERKTLAGIKKTEAETSQIGKVSPTTAAQIAWEREKMNNNTEEKTPTAEQVKQYIRKEITTQAFKDMSKKEKKDFILANGGEPSDYGY